MRYAAASLPSSTRASSADCASDLLLFKRALGRRGLLQPVRYQAERRQLARDRHATFWDPPIPRDRVWQTDFTEFETATHETWRIAAVVDYWSKALPGGAGLGDPRGQGRDRRHPRGHGHRRGDPWPPTHRGLR
jgi:hypothetical protein